MQLDEMEQIEAYWEGVPVGSFFKMAKSLNVTDRRFLCGIPH